jgi:fatty acid desaturase
MEIDSALALSPPGGLDRATLLQLSRRSNAKGLGQLAVHLALLAVTGGLVWLGRGGLWLIPAIVLHGVAVDFLFCPLHECVHRTAFASRWLNDAVGRVCGAALILPLEYFRLFHFAHHRFTQDPARDPERAAPKPATVGQYLWLATGLPNWRRRIDATLRHALTGQVSEPFIAPSKRDAIAWEARWLWAVYLAIAAGSLASGSADALIYWILPAIAGQPFLRLFLLAEHAGCAMNDDMFTNTRTTYTHPFVRILGWRMSYHAEHHAYPSVPFHALAAVNARIRDRLQVTAPGYRAVQAELLRAMRPPAGRRRGTETERESHGA